MARSRIIFQLKRFKISRGENLTKDLLGHNIYWLNNFCNIVNETSLYVIANFSKTLTTVAC